MEETLHVPVLYLSNGAISLRVLLPPPRSPWGRGEEGVRGLSFRLEEVYVFQSTGGSGLWERLMVIVGWGCEGPSCTFTSCCTGGPGGFRKLPGLWATNKGPQRKQKKGSIPVYETHCPSSPCCPVLLIPPYRPQNL